MMLLRDPAVKPGQSSRLTCVCCRRESPGHGPVHSVDGKARNGHALWLFLLTMTDQRDVKRW